MRIAVVVVSGLLAACSSRTEPLPTFTSCDDAKAYYAAQTGKALIAPVTFTPNRVIKPNSAVTMDFNAQRLNVYIDDAGHILKATCG